MPEKFDSMRIAKKVITRAREVNGDGDFLKATHQIIKESEGNGLEHACGVILTDVGVIIRAENATSTV